MPEYAKMKNADLEALLKTRGLPTGGKKADMVDRLTKDDEKAAEPAAPAGAAAVVHPEDEIDWDDDEPAKPAPAAEAAPAETTAPEAAATAKAGGTGQPPNPQDVPNQVADIDPAATNDLAVKPPVEENETNADGDTATEETKAPPPDYSRGLAASTIDEEIEKRKARAKRFGLNIENDEGLKKLERKKKFGETGPPQGMDEALPERERARKRGRDDNDDAGRNKRRGGGAGGAGGGGGRSGGGRQRGRGQRDGDRKREDNRDDKSRGTGGWMSAEDRQKAEARKNKWAAPAA
ncbi:hypothetical protein BS50DRAFT_585393 [Corynespora cassiicola Philippines]|uniref:SAP domain-containing protein n=1 Tax=Corynespora cassiicola Philippines TaxID=1448308 RepID=A0A2T2NXS5_CORCC|nr:hypothetical protein BS50DRAFT_585393 [Corynespora cassiicola Philippines]